MVSPKFEDLSIYREYSPSYAGKCAFLSSRVPPRVATFIPPLSPCKTRVSRKTLQILSLFSQSAFSLSSLA